MKKVFAYVLFTIVIMTFDGNGLYASGDFDILGIKLGMTPEDLVKVKPGCPRTSEYKDYRKDNIPSKFLGVCGGPALGWQIQIQVAGEPYGNGVFEIIYQKSVDTNVDTKIFISELKTQLEGKYGKASFEEINMNIKRYGNINMYAACWGDHCSEIKGSDYDFVSHASARLSKGKYLLVSFYGTIDIGYKWLIFHMFDTSPYHVQKIEQDRRAAEAAKKKIEF